MTLKRKAHICSLGMKTGKKEETGVVKKSIARGENRKNEPFYNRCLTKEQNLSPTRIHITTLDNNFFERFRQ